jgi:hypothetical protein
MSVRLRKLLTEWVAGEALNEADFNDTFDAALGGLYNIPAKAEVSMTKNTIVDAKGSTTVPYNTQANGNNISGVGLFSVLQKININNSPMNKLAGVSLSIGVPFDGNTLSYSTVAELFATDISNNPVGSVIATSNTITASAQAGFSVNYVFSTEPLLSANTDYVIVFRNIPKRSAGGNNFANIYYTNNPGSGVSKTSSTNNNIFDVTYSASFSQASITYKSAGLVVNKSVLSYLWLGFVENTSVNAGDNVIIKPAVGTIEGFTGLVTGQVYYLTATGGLQTTANAYRVGVALSPTTLHVLRQTN